MVKTWVLNPPFFPKFSRPQRSPAVTKSGTLYFPVWLAGCTALLEERGIETVLTDAPADGYDLETVMDYGKALNPALIVVDTSTPSIENDLMVCRCLKYKLPKAFLVLVGTHVSVVYDSILKSSPWIDAVARREYDFTILELAETLKKCGGSYPGREDLDSISGLSFRDSAGKVIHNIDRPFIENLDDLPWVSRAYKKHLNVKNYFNPNSLYPMITILTSRGCPFRCKFCVYPQVFTGRKFRYRSVEDVIDEIKFIMRTFPEVKSLFFEDDTLTSNKKRCLTFTDNIIKNKINIAWTANSRVDPDLETLQQLKKAGCRTLCVGFESGCQTILDGMGKGIKISKMRSFVKNAQKTGIMIHGCFMFGFPEENNASAEKTIALSMELNPDTAQFYPVMVYPGTEAYRLYDEKGWVVKKSYSEWLTENGQHNCVIRNECFTPNQLVELCDDARKRFYLRFSYILKKMGQVVSRPDEAKRILKAAKPFLRYLIVSLCHVKQSRKQ
ncbi:MAG: radical SAM protein [Desulfobacteraceae bacterium]